MSKMSLFPEKLNTMTSEELALVTEDLGIEYADLAKRLNVDRKTITRWLHGESTIPGAVALLLRVAFDIHHLSHRWAGEGIASQDTPTTRKMQ